jgi:hypothetical protein
MFKRLAISRFSDFRFADFRFANFRFGELRSLQPRRVALRGAGFFIDTHSNDTHSNDNLPGFRRPKGQRRIPSPALACHWFNHNGRLECRWQAAPSGDAPIGDFDEHGTMGSASGPSSVHPRGRGLALTG